MKNIIYIIFIFFLSCKPKSENDIEKFENINFEKNYIGKINDKLDVIFHLKSNNGKISGFYFYNEVNIGCHEKLQATLKRLPKLGNFTFLLPGLPLNKDMLLTVRNKSSIAFLPPGLKHTTEMLLKR